MGWKGIKTGLVRRKGGRSGESEAGRTGDTYPGKCKERLYYYFPYLDGAFACISGKGSEETRTIGTDGEFFLFSPEYLLELYVKKPEAVRRGYLHMLLHCLYLHLFLENQEDRRLWNLACDIAVEQIISREKIPVLETGGNAKKIREKVFHILGNGADSAEKICRKLKEQTFPFHLEELEETFHFDDHTLWVIAQEEKWEKDKRKMEQTSFLYCRKPPRSPETTGKPERGPEGRCRPHKIRKIRLQKISPPVFRTAGGSGTGYGEF